MKRASIDIGTNSILLLVVEGEGDKLRPIHQEIREPRLGRGLWESGSISSDSITEIKKALRELATAAKCYGAERIIAFGTEVFRSASNGVSAAKELSEYCGLDIRIRSRGHIVENDGFVIFSRCVGHGRKVPDQACLGWIVVISGDMKECIHIGFGQNASGEEEGFVCGIGA